ncbi:MAG: hypothetical protein ACFFEN_17895 [Candidatus Thorarchaeota archaeon]
MVNFILLIEELIDYNKKDIDKGQTPLKIYELCSCIRETFCLSYSFRKNNNLYLYFFKEHILVSLLGIELRYLGPDERSQALLLERALNTAKGLIKLGINGRKKSTPGIYLRKFTDDWSFIADLSLIVKGTNYILLENNDSIIDDREEISFDGEFVIDDNCIFIIPVSPIFRNTHKFLTLFKKMKNIKFFSLSKIKQIENKILYINFRKDHQETL